MLLHAALYRRGTKGSALAELALPVCRIEQPCLKKDECQRQPEGYYGYDNYYTLKLTRKTWFAGHHERHFLIAVPAAVLTDSASAERHCSTLGPQGWRA